MAKVKLRYEIVFEKELKDVTNDSLMDFDGECKNKLYKLENPTIISLKETTIN